MHHKPARLWLLDSSESLPTAGMACTSGPSAPARQRSQLQLVASSDAALGCAVPAAASSTRVVGHVWMRLQPMMHVLRGNT